MTYILAPGRALSQQLAARISRISRIPNAKTLSRVTLTHASDFKSNNLNPIQSHSYATDTSTPKAETTRATKPRAAAKPKSATKRKSATTTKKSTTGKATKKAKKPKKPKRVKKAKKAVKKLTPEQETAKKTRLAARKDKAAARKVVEKARDLRTTALLKAPKRLPETSFAVLITEMASPGSPVVQLAKTASTRYRSMRPEEKERLNHLANANRAKNDRAYTAWVTGYTPTEIKKANLARLALRREAKQAGSKKQYNQIQDQRQVKRAASAYNLFLRDRFASGDLKNMQIREVGPLVAREFKALTAGELKPYTDEAKVDHARYEQEYRNVYGEDSHGAKAAKKPKATSSTTST